MGVALVVWEGHGDYLTGSGDYLTCLGLASVVEGGGTWLVSLSHAFRNSGCLPHSHAHET